MHADEFEFTDGLVRRLVRGQFPEWGDLPLSRVESAGTDHAIYRLGDQMSVRLPRHESSSHQLDREARWLPEFAPRLPLAIPVPLGVGVPADGYPFDWSIYPWLEGENATVATFRDEIEAARKLADFVKTLRTFDTAGGPGPGPWNFFRGAPLRDRDAVVRRNIPLMTDYFEAEAMTALWDVALALPPSPLPHAWLHGDLLPGNLLIQDGVLTGVIDWGGMGVGDSVYDLIPAWAVFGDAAREVYRTVLEVDDVTWKWGRAWALVTGVTAVPYYRDTNPVLAGVSLRAAQAAMADFLANGR